MKQIGENIAKLRRANGMTQEQLAEIIGVSAQSVSKWETSTTMPDIMLLPVLADIFGVTVDAMYGRIKTDEGKRAEDVFSETIETLLDGIGGFMGQHSAEEKRKYREALLEDPHLKTGIMNCGEGAVFYCGELGAALLKKQKDGVFASEGTCNVLDMLGDEKFRLLVRHLFEEKYNSMTIGSVAKMLSCETDIAKEYLKALLDWGILESSVLDLGEEKVTVHKLNHFARNKLFMLQVVDAYAREISVTKNHMYCWAG
ncbi:MAG: helix-turn-helix transcriptional regulator [Clostridia bacterium]|nr:helix-turn-helix transcriptional regulator [Clostridia bacterium]